LVCLGPLTGATRDGKHLVPIVGIQTTTLQGYDSSDVFNLKFQPKFAATIEENFRSPTLDAAPVAG
jgi:hypothetical protein